MGKSDLPFVVGPLKHAKAVHVTSAIECHHAGLWRRLVKTMLLNGTLTAVVTVVSTNKQ